MTLVISAQPVPLKADADGAVRVAGTRVLLDTVVTAFQQGASAEQIADQYPTLAIGEVYAVIAYYLRHMDEVDAYVAHRRQEADRLQTEVTSRFGRAGIRKRLVARTAGVRS